MFLIARFSLHLDGAHVQVFASFACTGAFLVPLTQRFFHSIHHHIGAQLLPGTLLVRLLLDVLLDGIRRVGIGLGRLNPRWASQKKKQAGILFGDDPLGSMMRIGEVEC